MRWIDLYSIHDDNFSVEFWFIWIETNQARSPYKNNFWNNRRSHEFDSIVCPIKRRGHSAPVSRLIRLSWYPTKDHRALNGTWLTLLIFWQVHSVRVRLGLFAFVSGYARRRLMFGHRSAIVASSRGSDYHQCAINASAMERSLGLIRRAMGRQTTSIK